MFWGFVLFLFFLFFYFCPPQLHPLASTVTQKIRPWHDFKRAKLQLSELTQSGCILFIKASKHAKKNCFIVSVCRANITSNPNIG